MGCVALDEHAVPASVNVNVAVPGLTAVTKPLLLTVATDGLLVLHTPPEVGDKVVVVPAHNIVLPVIDTTGLAWTIN